MHTFFLCVCVWAAVVWVMCVSQVPVFVGKFFHLISIIPAIWFGITDDVSNEHTFPPCRMRAHNVYLDFYRCVSIASSQSDNQTENLYYVRYPYPLKTNRLHYIFSSSFLFSFNFFSLLLFGLWEYDVCNVKAYQQNLMAVNAQWAWMEEREKRNSSVNGLIQICQNQLIPLEHCHKMDYGYKTTVFSFILVGFFAISHIALFLFNFYFADDCVNIVPFRLLRKSERMREKTNHHFVVCLD